MPLKPEAAARKDATNAFAPSMEHRHFATIAAILASLVDTYDNPLTKHDVIEAFADQIARTNSKFDRQRFLTACGKEA